MIRLETAIEKAAATEATRPTLSAVYYDAKNQAAMASDGFILAIVPTTPEGERVGEEVGTPDRSGIIPLAAVDEARKAAGRKDDPRFNLSEAGKVAFQSKTGTVVTDLVDGRYPDVKRIMWSVPQEGDKDTVTFAIDAGRLLDLAKALHYRKGPGHRGLILTLKLGKDERTPIGVRPLAGNEEHGRRGAIMRMLNGR